MGEGKLFVLRIPANHPAENRLVSYLPEAYLGDGCAENLGSQCRCPEPQTEPSAPPGQRAPPLCGSTAADAPKQFIWFKISFNTPYFVLTHLLHVYLCHVSHARQLPKFIPQLLIWPFKSTANIYWRNYYFTLISLLMWMLCTIPQSNVMLVWLILYLLLAQPTLFFELAGLLGLCQPN